jgi:glycerol-3-phosphate cytidylyltransferase
MIIGIVASAFDLLHPGHCLLLKEAKETSDHVIAALHTDPSIERASAKWRPVQTTFERYVQLQACRYVDEIIPYDTEKDLKHIMLIKGVTDIFLGAEYANTDYTGCDLNLNTHFHLRNHTFSSTDLRKRLTI